MKCDQCDWEGAGQQSLRMHQLRKHEGMGPGHPQWGAGPKKWCQVCKKDVSASYFPRHMRQRHYMPTTPAVVPAPERVVAVVPEVPIPIRSSTKRKFRQLDQFVVLEDDQGGLWLAEQIRS